MIQVQLKTKHYYYIANQLKNFQASMYFNLLNRIRMQCSTMQDDDMIGVNVEPNDFKKIFSLISEKPEGQANKINTEMMDLLSPQLQAGVQSGDVEWTEAYQGVVDIRQKNWQIADEEIESGRLFINTP